MKTISVLVLSAFSCLGLPHLARGQALPFQQSPPPGTPVPAAAPLPADTSPSPAAAAATPIPDGFVMRDGNVYVVKNGALTRVTQEQVLRIAPNGMVTGFDGRTWLIPAGQMITTDGRVVPVDPALFTTDERTRAASNVTGENRSGLAPSTPSAQPTTSSSNAAPNQPNGFSEVPDTRGKRGTGSMRGSSSTPIVDVGGGTAIDSRTNEQPSTSQNNQGTNTSNANPQNTTSQQQATTSGTTSTGATATPNQRASSGTTVAPRSTGNTTNPNAVRTSPSSSTSGSRATSTSSSTGTRSTSSGGTSGSGTTGSGGSTSSGSAGGGSVSGGATGGAIR